MLDCSSKRDSECGPHHRSPLTSFSSTKSTVFGHNEFLNTSCLSCLPLVHFLISNNNGQSINWFLFRATWIRGLVFAKFVWTNDHLFAECYDTYCVLYSSSRMSTFCAEFFSLHESEMMDASPKPIGKSVCLSFGFSAWRNAQPRLRCFPRFNCGTVSLALLEPGMKDIANAWVECHCRCLTVLCAQVTSTSK